MSVRSYRRGLMILTSVALGSIGTIAMQSFPGTFGSVEAAENSTLAPPEAWRIQILEDMDLDPLPDIDWMPVASGTKKNSETMLFEGDNTVSVWEAGPAKLIIDTPFPYDEFVVVLKGELLLSDIEGNTMTYKQGDMFMVPKGFVGTWDMTEEYRELIVVDTESYNAE